MSDVPQLEEIRRDLTEGRTATPVTVRTFLSWFDAKRRTKFNVEHIDGQMADAGLQTVPSYLDTWIDNPIAIELIPDSQERDAASGTSDANERQASGSQPQEGSSEAVLNDDPSFRISRIASANSPPVSVKPNASLKEATTLMLARNFSQIPVMQTPHSVKGVVSWASIGARVAANKSGPDVQSYMDGHYEVNLSASLFSAIQIILEHNYVLTRSSDNKIAGIVTADDITMEFELISTPFLLLAEIENNLRFLISSKLTLDDVRLACGQEYLPKRFTRVSDLSFGNYVRVFEHVDNWSKLGLQLDRVTFCAELIDVNEIRNDVMHFDPDPLQPSDLLKLRNVAKLLNMFRNLGAF